MRAISAILFSLMSMGTRVLAAGRTAEGEDPGILASCFLSFCVMMALFQVIPVTRLLAAKVKGMFHRT